MKNKESIWQKLGMHEWLLKQADTDTMYLDKKITTEDVFELIVSKFKESIAQMSFANRVVFFHEYVICFNSEDYKEFTENKKGIFGLIIHETIKECYAILDQYRKQGKVVEPSSNKWVFRFVSHPEYRRGDKSIIGKLLPGSMKKKEENLRVTFIPRQTGIGETFDVHNDILETFTFYSEGYFEVPFQMNYIKGEDLTSIVENEILGRLEAIIPDKDYIGKKIEYLIKSKEILVSGKDEESKDYHLFKIPTDWVNTPHLIIRFDEKESKFFVASFGEKTMLNENEMTRSDMNNIEWTHLPINSKLVLNGIVGINLFKS